MLAQLCDAAVKVAAVMTMPITLALLAVSGNGGLDQYQTLEAQAARLQITDRPVELAASFSTLTAGSVRDVVTFDFGWRHRTGLHSEAKPDDRPPINTDPGVHPDEAQPKYDDSEWKPVQLPHDALIEFGPSKVACPTGCSGKSYIPRHVLWYRKRFSLPAGWAGSAIWLDFEGSFRKTTVWVNGLPVTSHDCGYTPFRVRLDNISSVHVGGENVVAVYVDPDNGDAGGRDHGSGWWYEGGGIYRHVQLVRASPLHVEQDGLFAYSNLTKASDGSVASATVHVSATIVDVSPSPSPALSLSTCVSFSIVGPGSDRVVASTFVGNLRFSPSAAGASAMARAELHVPSPAIWSAATPVLYTVHASVHVGGCAAAATDAVSAPHGFRTLHYDANTGFFLNGEHFKVRGFCDHNSFAVVGMAVPARINLFRAQALRAVGGNGRRTSHNPPDVSLLDIYDRVGVVVMDENRLFANETRYVTNMGVLVKRDRNHPSVIIWSFCNEGGCEGSHELGGPRFNEISYRFDGSRPTLANMFTFGDLLSNTVDVQGFSHQNRQKLDKCHAQLPHKPIFMSECCSCNTMRSEDEGCETTYDNPHTACIQKSFNARCAESNAATNASDGVDYAVGTMVWTLFDYYGEPPVGGLEVIGTYGQFDLCGFPKAASLWYRMQWLYGVPDGPDKPFRTDGGHEVHLVESWESPDAFPSTVGQKTRAVHAYSSAPKVELLVNGKSKGVLPVTRMVDGPGSYAEWTKVEWESGIITAIARDAAGKPVANTSRRTNSATASIALTLDAPSSLTGTGNSLLLDGQDAALVRASILDAAGHVKHLASNLVTFRIVSGPGRIQGTHNGDPHALLASSDPTFPAYHGLVRAVVRTTSTAAIDAHQRSLLRAIDLEGPFSAPKSPSSSSSSSLLFAKGASGADGSSSIDPIVVEASSPGMAPVRLSIPVSADAATAGVMAAAAASAGKPVSFF